MKKLFLLSILFMLIFASCAKYNANMVKFNYRFTNVGDLPQGATEVLPREYKPYLTK